MLYLTLSVYQLLAINMTLLIELNTVELNNVVINVNNNLYIQIKRTLDTFIYLQQS